MSKAKNPTIEIVTFADSEAVLKDESLLNPVFEAVLQSKGSQHVYTGKCIDDGETNTRFICVAWDAQEDHQRLIDDPIVYPKLLEAFNQCYSKEFTMFHVPASGDTAKVFSAPVTELTTVLSRGQGGGPDLQQLFVNWAEAARTAHLAKEYQPFVFGQTNENSNVHFMIGGWATKDHHLNCIDTDLKKEIEQLADETEEMKVKHCILREYKR